MYPRIQFVSVTQNFHLIIVLQRFVCQNSVYFSHTEEPPLEYWKVLAEQRRLALSETLKENEDLHTQVAGLKKRVNELENKTHDLEYFAMMYELISKVDSQL